MFNYNEETITYPEKELIDVKFYYYRDFSNRPVVTVCLIHKGEELFARGISICSILDNPVKKIGRWKAYGRAFKALTYVEDTEPIRDDIAFNINCCYSIDFSFEYKSYFKPEPTEFEKRLISKRKDA